MPGRTSSRLRNQQLEQESERRVKTEINQSAFSPQKDSKMVKYIAKRLHLPQNDDVSKQCKQIVKKVKQGASRNAFLKELMSSMRQVPENELCWRLVYSLYSFLHPRTLPSFAPIEVNEAQFKTWLTELEEETISEEIKEKLQEALNVKYCYCVKRLLLNNRFEKYVNKKPVSQTLPYAICASSIYKKRNLDVPAQVSKSCRNKYKWYRATSS